MYERKGDKLLPFPRFLGRVAFSVILALGLVLVALLLGTSVTILLRAWTGSMQNSMRQ